MIRPQPSMLHKPDVLALVWELHSRLPETRSREPYELQSLLWSLRYCEDLIPECEIAAAIEAAPRLVPHEAGVQPRRRHNRRWMGSVRPVRAG